MNAYEELMDRALALASKAKGCTSPNPMVGCVICDKYGKIVGEGYHKKAGTPHAEVHALNQAGAQTEGGTVFVTLEPCSHFGKTPPCSQALIKAKPAKVVVAVQDPNPKVNGQGIRELREAGIEVVVGVREQEAKDLNDIFFKWSTTKIPFVALKMATSLDGKIATHSGSSRWITCENARRFAHELRATYDAILVGATTLRKDNPALTCRMVQARNPIRIVVSASLDFPQDSIMLTDTSTQTIIATTHEHNHRLEYLSSLPHLTILKLAKTKQGQVDLQDLLAHLADMNITSLLVEGGSEIHASFLKNKLVDKIYAIIAPKIIGGDGISPLGPLGIDLVEDALELVETEHRVLGRDILISGKFKNRG